MVKPLPQRSRRLLKKLAEYVAELARKHPGKKIEVWAEDEARLGLQPVIRRQWFKVGSRPRARHRIQYKWLYTYAFVHPASGRTHWLLLPSVSCTLMELALASFAKEYVKEDTLIVLLWDQAGFHQTQHMQIPDGIAFFPLPPYTPELQPAERLWPCLHETIANRWVRTMEQLEAFLSERIKALIKMPDYIQALTGFEWILLAQNNIT